MNGMSIGDALGIGFFCFISLWILIGITWRVVKEYKNDDDKQSNIKFLKDRIETLEDILIKNHD